MRRELSLGGVLSPARLPLTFLVLWTVPIWALGPLIAVAGALVITAAVASTIVALTRTGWFGQRDLPSRTGILTFCLIGYPALLACLMLGAFGLGVVWTPVLTVAIGLGLVGVHVVTRKPVPLAQSAPARPPAPLPPRQAPPLRPAPPQPPARAQPAPAWPARSQPPPAQPARTQPAPAPPERVEPARTPPARPSEDHPPTRAMPGDPEFAVAHARSLLVSSGPAAALPVLRDAVADPAVDPAAALAVADELVEAESARAERTGDDRAYNEAIRVLTDLVQRHPRVPGGKSMLHSHRAQYLLFQAGRLADGADASDARATGRLHALFAATESELREAVAAASPGSSGWARESTALGLLLCQGVQQGEPDRCDEGITLIRQAAEMLPPGRQRDQALLDLAEALTARVRLRDNEPDRREIHRLLTQVARPGSPLADQAVALLAGLQAPRPS